MSSACTPFDREPDDPSLTLGVPGCGAPPRLQRGMTLGRYIVLDALGVGGMGEVVSAYDPDLDRKVALKVLRRSTRRRLGDEGRSRMLHEARAIASLCDRNVLPVYHVGEFEDELFLVMKLVAGVPLGRHCRGRPWQEVLPLLVAAGRGLAAAHRAGLVHRDVKPSNVMVDRDGEVYVMDFGLARVDGHGSIIPALPDSDEIDLGTLRGPPLGEHGKIVGTPVYMAPEQHEGAEADARADQFSFCIVAWELLLGVFPFDAGAPGGLLAAKRAGPTRGVHVRVVPRRIERALLRGLAGRPEDRHPSMGALLGALQGDAGRGRVRMAALATVVLGSAALAWAWPRAQPCASGEERIARVWDDARREQLGASFLAQDADELGARVIATLDEQADRWASAYDDTCAARSSGDEAQADARMACLGQRAVELGALVEVLGHADTNTATHALPAVHAWSSAGLCEHGDARSQAPAAERESAELTARARALVQAGRYRDAIAAADDAVALAHQRDDVHARCEALIVQGDALIRDGNADRSAASFEQTVQEAAGAGVDE
ncbi:MAG: serine/threonine protein kinase, partial [Deltaproteobacteria bacterium]|nr:serine/threonine protein kinase [Nannocystaceae bacterium]